jgi:8-oxo-dGTP diphosphatase
MHEINQTFGNKLRLRVSGILIEDNQILLIRHKMADTRPYLWSPPGGGLHFGESVSETLYREFLEETGLIIEIGDFLFVHEFLAMPLHAIELFFEVKRVGGELKKGYDPEISAENQIIDEVKFMSGADLSNEQPICLHYSLRELNAPSDILQKRAYSISLD